MHKPHHLVTSCCLAFLLAGVSGCFSNTTISGKVEVNHPFDTEENLAPKGKVIFFSQRTSQTIEALINEDGTYSARVPDGPTRVALQLELKPTPLVGIKNVPRNLLSAKQKAEKWQQLVDNYSSIDKTPLTIMVGEDPPTFNIKLALPEGG